MIQIIQAGTEHLLFIRGIALKTWPHTFKDILSKDQIAYMLEMMYSISSLTDQTQNKNHVFLLAAENKEFIGFASYELNYKGTGKTKIHKIYLLPKAQGKGAGKLLMNEVEKRAVVNNESHLTLNVNRFNKAVDFYTHYGFEVIGTEDIDIGNGYLMEDFIMEKKLNNEH